MTADVVDQKTGAGEPLAADEIRAMRERIDEIDQVPLLRRTRSGRLDERKSENQRRCERR